MRRRRRARRRRRRNAAADAAAAAAAASTQLRRGTANRIEDSLILVVPVSEIHQFFYLVFMDNEIMVRSNS